MARCRRIDHKSQETSKLNMGCRINRRLWETSRLTTRRLPDLQQEGDFQISKTTQHCPSWKEDHQAAQELDEKEAKWVSADPSSLRGSDFIMVGSE